MKVVFIGAGSYRYLSVARSILAEPAVMDGGEIRLFDLNHERSATMAEMIQKTPEYSRVSCRVSWDITLDEALDGADVVCVVLMAGNLESYLLGNRLCSRHGFPGSDQLSPNGALLALKGGPILMNIARKMERLCPQAWLLDFANPVAVLSAAVNNHTRIKCLGVCAGYTNHMWDLPRILGTDEQAVDADILSAGVNHLSIITGGTIKGRPIYDLLREHVDENWTPPVLSDRWNERAKQNITQSVKLLVKLYRKFGTMVFSSEEDGLAHLDMEGHYVKMVADGAQPSVADVLALLKRKREFRQKADVRFRSFLNEEMSETDWDRERPGSLYLLREDENIMVRIIKALSGCFGELKIATSFPNRGAVAGLTDRTVLEYSQILSKDGIRPVPGLEIPAVFHGLIAALANHQTLLGDAIATNDPSLLFQAFYSYPVQQDTRTQKEMWKALMKLNRNELPEEFQKVEEYLDF
jgi:alpha-galactosidase/6-phospho-beta-glucosidase family protein